MAWVSAPTLRRLHHNHRPEPANEGAMRGTNVYNKMAGAAKHKAHHPSILTFYPS